MPKNGSAETTLSTMPHKKPRRTPAEMKIIKDGMVRLAREHGPLTVRQLFYMLVSEGLIQKTEAEYKTTVVRLALELRRAGLIAWTDVVDRTRWFFKPKTFHTLDDALAETARTYRRSLWSRSPVQVQVWCESMSVAGIIDSAVAKWDVPLFPGKGYSSHDFLRTSARSLAHDGRNAVIYLLGDFDASGRDILRFVEQTIREYAAEVDETISIEFHAIAVTEWQIKEWRLQGHPAKHTDSRARRYGITEAVELEAIRPAQLRDEVEKWIMTHVDPDELERIRKVEALERETLLRIAGGVA